MFECVLPNDEATLAFGNQLARAVNAEPCIIFLRGQLGAGKTTLTRGFLRGLGYEDKVKSPTFTLVEPYQIDKHIVYHFDLYRVTDPQELIHMGIQDYFTGDAICLIEWPELGANLLPTPDILCELTFEGLGRHITVLSQTQRGEKIVQRVKQ